MSDLNAALEPIFALHLDKAIPTALTLRVDGRDFDVSDATLTNSGKRAVWTNPGLRWSTADVNTQVGIGLGDYSRQQRSPHQVDAPPSAYGRCGRGPEGGVRRHGDPERRRGSSILDSPTFTYAWTQTSGTTVTLSDAAAQSPTFTAPSVREELVFSLVVNDGTSDSAPDTVTVAVRPVPEPHHRPLRPSQGGERLRVGDPFADRGHRHHGRQLHQLPGRLQPDHTLVLLSRRNLRRAVRRRRTARPESTGDAGAVRRALT